MESSSRALLEMTKNHLTSKEAEVFLLNEVISSSSSEVTTEMLENIRRKIAAFCSNSELKVGREEIRPFSWHKFIDVAKKIPQMSLTDARDLWQKEKGEIGEASNISPDDVAMLEEFQQVVVFSEIDLQILHCSAVLSSHFIVVYFCKIEQN